MKSDKNTCCLIGHNKLYDDESQIRQWILECVLKAVEGGYIHFICGGSVGFDMLAAEVIVELKKSGHKILLELALPFKNEFKPLRERLLFSLIETNADMVTYVNDNYSKNCYTERNKYMVDNSALVVVYNRECLGGVFNTVEYAKMIKKTIYAL